jgi:hypothetical protein
VRVLIVRDGATRKDFRAASEDLGDIDQIRPGDVERALASEGR